MSCEKGDRGFGGLKAAATGGGLKAAAAAAAATAAIPPEYNIKEKSYPNI
jgi:hypothetical protein